MTFVFKPAGEVKSTRPLLIGLAGGTGSGKTYSALRLAKGLVGNGKVAAVDTENGRLLEYQSEFPDVLYASLGPPYTPDNYLEAMQAGAQVAQCVIVDSVSHEWEGVGGLLEWANAKAEDMAQKAKRNGQQWADAEKYTFPAWKEPKIAHHKMVAWMISAPCHLILCFRAKEKNGFEEIEYTSTKQGQTHTGKKKEIVNLGWQPITEAGLPYEMSFLAVLTARNPGVPDFTFKALSHTYNGIFNGQPISETHGQKLAELSSSSAREGGDTPQRQGDGAASITTSAMGAPAEPPANSAPKPGTLAEAKAAARAKAAKGTPALDNHMASLSDAQRDKLKTMVPELKDIALQADLAGDTPLRTDTAGNPMHATDAG